LARRQVHAIRERYSRIRARDYFDAGNGKRAAELVTELEVAAADDTPPTTRRTTRPTESYRRKTWVTRERPGIDRMASAWFIRRFVDSKASFSFIAPSERMPHGSIPFDMYGVDFGHHGSHC